MDTTARRVLLCSCDGTIPLDRAALRAAGAPEGLEPVARHLCRDESDCLRAAFASGAPLLIACTQETPLFEELRSESGPESGPAAETDIRYTSVRERAGWSDEAAATQPKIVALLHEALLPEAVTTSLPLTSSGRLLVLGRDDTALQVAQQVAERLDVTVLLWSDDAVMPLARNTVPLFQGQVIAAAGHFGAFHLTVAHYAVAQPYGRGAVTFAPPAPEPVEIVADLILDLRGAAPLFPAPERREGYRRVDPAAPTAIQRALLELTDRVGTFDTPRYIDLRPAQCAHSRNRKTGCTRCLDVCPTSALQSIDGSDAVVIDPYVCAGCGSCAAVCPTEAARYTLPPETLLLRRLHTLLTHYRKAGGGAPIVLIHDDRHGSELLAPLARFGRGLPARVLPLALATVTHLNATALLAALAWGAEQVRVLTAAIDPAESLALEQQLTLAQALLRALGGAPQRLALLAEIDPDAVDGQLRALLRLEPSPSAAGFLPLGNRRTLLRLALQHLRTVHPRSLEQAGTPDILPLPAGAPFGSVTIDTAGCTLCLACVGVCPTQSLRDHPDTPQLSFVEESCIQCGLCRVTCPEAVMTLTPHYSLAADVRTARLLKEEEPFLCVQCGQPFGVRSSIERITAALEGRHPLYPDAAAGARLRMCEDCRVIAEYEHMATLADLPPRPLPRTGDT